MKRVLGWFGLRDSRQDAHRTEKTVLINEARGIRLALDRVAVEFHEMAASLRETNHHLGSSGIPWQDMARGLPVREDE